jgi:excalibur calcium-binding domain-containing protein
MKQILGPVALVVGVLATGFFMAGSADEKIEPSALSANSISSVAEMPAGTYERDDGWATERSYADAGDRDCADFSSQNEAQRFFEEMGGPSEDYHNLDRDGDGVVCETLP